MGSTNKLPGLLGEKLLLMAFYAARGGDFVDILLSYLLSDGCLSETHDLPYALEGDEETAWHDE
jgi:hypothetical protein